MLVLKGIRGDSPVYVYTIVLLVLTALVSSHAFAFPVEIESTSALRGAYGNSGEHVVIRLSSGQLREPIVFAGIPNPDVWKRAQSITVFTPKDLASFTVHDLIAGEPSVISVSADSKGASVSIIQYSSDTSKANSSSIDMVILVPNDPTIRDYAERIAALHEEEQELKVRVVSIDEIKQYPKAILPEDVKSYICKESRLYNGLFDSVVEEYNYDLALRLMSFAKSLVDEGVKYLLIIGGARDIPPIYYCSPTLDELVGNLEAIVPTDYYYADPDMDGVAELAVGRIPFTDSLSLSMYYSALEEWVNGGDWQNLALVSGGATFLTTLFVGEAAALTAANKLAELGVDVDALLLSQGNYEGVSLKGYVGRYGIYYIVAHGTGNSLLDYVPGGVWNYDTELKLYSSEVVYAAKPGVYVLPSCRDGYWDTDLVPPTFKPPSLAQALLARRAAIAYIGFARVAIEVIDAISLSGGRLTLGLAGADKLLQLFIENLEASDTLGEAWAKALSSYNLLPSSSYVLFLTRGEEKLGDLVVREAVLLGDPAAPNPWKRTAQKTSYVSLSVDNGVVIGARAVIQVLARYTTGTLYAVKPVNDTVRVEFKGACPTSVSVSAIRRVLGYFLVDVYPLESEIVQNSVNSCALEISVKPGIPGLLRIVASVNNTVESFYIVAAGAYADNGIVKLYGLDVLSVAGDEPLLIKLDNKTLDVISGAETAAIIPVHGTGILRVEPAYNYASILGGKLVASDYEKLLPLFTVEVTNPLHSAEKVMYAGGEVCGSQVNGYDSSNTSYRPLLGERYASVAVIALASVMTVLIFAVKLRRMEYV